MRRGIIAALVCLLCVPAAVAAEPADPSRLLGTWESDAAVLTFNADGTAVMERTDGVIVEMDWSVFAHAQVFGVDMLILRAVSGGETGYGQAAFPSPDELALTVFNPSVDWDALAAVLTRRPGTEAPPGTELAPSLLPSLDPAAGDFLGTWQGEHNGQQLTIVFDADRVADFQAGRTILVVPWSVSGAVDVGLTGADAGPPGFDEAGAGCSVPSFVDSSSMKSDFRFLINPICGTKLFRGFANLNKCRQTVAKIGQTHQFGRKWSDVKNYLTPSCVTFVSCKDQLKSKSVLKSEP